MRKDQAETIHLGVILFAALVFFAGLFSVSAQEITGSIGGIVKDASGAVIPNATVMITDRDKKVDIRTVQTNGNGEYSAPLIPVSVYTITIEAPNFKRFVAENVKVDVNQQRNINATLEAGGVAEVVRVEAAPLQVDTEAPTAGTLISGTQARELSLNNRNFVQLTTLVPGVSSNLADQVYVGTTNPFGQANLVSISVNGARSTANNWTVDGADTTDAGSNLTIQLYPSVDAIGEFKVLRSLYPAEEGRSGGGQINVVTKSGTSDFHGSAYEFFRNDKLNANNYLLNANPSQRDPLTGKARRPQLRYNNFGFTVGGPLYLPRFGEGGSPIVSGKNRTFFFFSNEYRRVITYSVFTATVPNAALKQGIFPVPVCLDIACTAKGTRITNINPVTQAYIRDIFSKIPEPNASLTLTSPQRNVFNFDQEILKIDHRFSDKLSAFYRLELDHIPTEEPNALFSSGSSIPGVSNTKTNSPGRSHVVRFTYALNPTTALEGGYAYSYGAILSQVTGLLNQANSPDINIPLPFTNTLGRVPTINFSNFNSLTTFGPYDNFSNNHKIQLNLSKIIGAHTTKFGVNLNWYRKHENAAGGNEGAFSFSGDDVYQEWANFLVGNVDEFTQNSKDITVDIRAKNHEFYGQDEWRVRPNLALYYGARVSFFRQPIDKNGFFTNFDPTRFDPTKAFKVTAGGNRVPGTGDPLNGIIVNNQNSPFGSKVTNENTNVAPRVGIAWDPFKKGTTSVRAGYGIYYDQIQYGGTYENVAFDNPPFVTSVGIANPSFANPASGTTEVDLSAPTIYGVSLPWETPYYQHWSLDVQHQFFRNTLLDVGYYGSKGTHLPGSIDINDLPPGAAVAAGIQRPNQQFTSVSSEFVLDQIRPYRGYRSINVVQNRFDSNYHSLQTYLQQRLSGNSQINIAYTWSHALTDAQTDYVSGPQNSYDLRSEYSRSQLDRRHVFVANFVYESPFYREQRGVIGHLLGGYEFSGIVTLETGLPFTVTERRDPAGIGFRPSPYTSGRPDQIGDPNNGPKTAQQFFNTGVFASVPVGQIRPGNAPRGAVNGPGLQRVDFSVFKNIKTSETTRIQLRGEAFNLLNHTNFSGLSTRLGAFNFGQVTAVRDPRIVQLAAKFYF